MSVLQETKGLCDDEQGLSSMFKEDNRSHMGSPGASLVRYESLLQTVIQYFLLHRMTTIKQ